MGQVGWVTTVHHIKLSQESWQCVFADLNPFQTKTAPRLVFRAVGNFILAPHPQFVQSSALGSAGEGVYS